MAPPRADASRRCSPKPPHAPSTTSSCLSLAHMPLFSLGMRPVNFSFLLSPHAHPHSSSLLRSSVHGRQSSPSLLLSNFVLHQHRRVSLPLPDPLFFLLSCMRSPEHRAGHFTRRRHSNSNRTEVPPLLLPRQEHHQHHICTPNLPNQFPSPSCTPVTGTPSPPSEPRRAGSVSSRTAASELPFYDSNHPQVCRELLNLFPHLSLTAGESPSWILIATTQLLLFKSIWDPETNLCSFLGSCLQNTRPSATHPSATHSPTTR
jgi:hypothetical protein